MILTGKAKEDFENWYSKEKPEGHWYSMVNFYGLVDSMQYGVYVDYFASVGLDISQTVNWYGFENGTHKTKHQFSILYVDYKNPALCSVCDDFSDIVEARNQAIDKANEIRNEQLKE